MSLGPHEQQLRALREKKAKRRAAPFWKQPEAPASPKESIVTTTNIPLSEMLGHDLRTTPAPKRRERLAPAKKKAAKKTKKAPAKKAKKKAAKATLHPRADLRPGSKLAIISGLLMRTGGCTRADVMDACDWPSVSMPQQAKALGVELESEKVPGQPTRYWVKPA